MKKNAIKYLKEVNINQLNKIGLKISIYKFFYYVELCNDPQIYFNQKSREENKIYLHEVYITNRNLI